MKMIKYGVAKTRIQSFYLKCILSSQSKPNVHIQPHSDFDNNKTTIETFVTSISEILEEIKPQYIYWPK